MKPRCRRSDGRAGEVLVVPEALAHRLDLGIVRQEVVAGTIHREQILAARLIAPAVVPAGTGRRRNR